jgi:hypothetical protein
VVVQEQVDLELVRRLLLFDHYLIELRIVQVVKPKVRVWIKVEVLALSRLPIFSIATSTVTHVLAAFIVTVTLFAVIVPKVVFARTVTIDT